jgi:hypothetical protein
VEKSLIKNTDGTFGCGICGKITDTKAHLKQHLETHMNLIFTCYLCYRQFGSKNSLMAHKSKKHKKDEIKKENGL